VANVITIARIKRPEPRVIRLVQPGTIPPRPKWMEGDSSYVESVARTCPKCGSADVWRGVWCHTPEIYLQLKRHEPAVKHSGRKRHSACLSCGEFRKDIQAVAYNNQEETEDELWWKEEVN